LIRAAQQGHEQCVDILIEAGADVNYARGKDGSTALIMASQKGHHEVVRSLVRAGADVNLAKTDEYADSPLIMAAHQGHVQCVDILIKAGAHVNYARGKDGCTALIMASHQGHIDVVRSLLAAGADPRLAIHNGFTALDIAKDSKHPQIVALLEAKIAELDCSA
jgi:ankyrin repeat protein